MFDDDFGCLGYIGLGFVSLIIIIFVYCKIDRYRNSIDYFPKLDRALEKKDFDKADKIVKKMERVAQTYRNPNCTFADASEAYYKVLNVKIEYLLNEGSDIGVDRLVTLFMGLDLGYPYVGRVSGINENNEVYNLVVSKHHAIMDALITRAIATKKEYMATRIVECYRPIVVTTLVKDNFIKKDEYECELSYEPREKADARVKDAIRHGAFR